MFEIVEDESLQGLFSAFCLTATPDNISDTLEKFGVTDVAFAAAVDFDSVDEYNVVDEYVDGIGKGIEIAVKLIEFRKSVPDARIHKFTFDDYADDDGVCLLIGTQKSIHDFLTHVIDQADNE